MKRESQKNSRICLVFIIGSIFPYDRGGIENWLYEMCKGLSKDYDIEIITMLSRQTKEEYPISDLNVELHMIPTLLSGPVVIRISRFLPKRLSNFLSSYFLSRLSYVLPALAFVFIRYFFKNRRIIFISMNPGLPYAPQILMRRKHFRRVCSVRGPNYELGWELPSLDPFFQALWRGSMRDSTLVLTNGFDTYELVKHINQNVKVIPNGVDFNRFSKSYGNKLERSFKKIVTIANLGDVKGIPHLVKSIPFIMKNYKKQFKVVFVGRGDSTKYLELAKELGVGKLVEFTGLRRDVPEVLADADIVACVSNPELKSGGMSHAAIESMAAGKPIVAWDSPVYQQLLEHEYSGYLVKDGDIRELGKGLAHLLKNEELAEHIGKNAQEEAKKFDFDILAKRLSDYLRELYT